MADRNSNSSALARPIWMKQAEEAKLKSEAEKAAAAKAAFEATFKDVDKNNAKKEPASPDSEAEEAEDLANKPLGPVDPSKCTAAGAGIAGGAACAPSSFVVVTKDFYGRKIPNGGGGAVLKVKISPGVGVGGSELEGIVKDQGDGSYTVTYVVPQRGNYMVHVECNGKPIMGSPFPVFFSAGSPAGAGGLLVGMPHYSSPFPNMVNQTMPNMPNYAGSVSGAFPGLLGMIPGVIPGETGGVLLPGVGATLGEVCREFMNGRCLKTDCKFNHPPHNMLMTALASTSSMGTLSQAPMAPSAAAMAAAQAIVAAQAHQAHALQVQAQSKSSKDSSGSPDAAGKVDSLKRTLQVSNLSPLLTVEQLKQLFSYCGAVVECTITDSKHFAYIEYSKPEDAAAGLALNNIDVGGRPLNVEMAKSLPLKSAMLNLSFGQSSVPLAMQQQVAVQQMQFQQALLMQQMMNTQQAANRAATMKSATELASARAAEISKKLKADGVGNEENEANRNSRSPPTSRPKSKSRSRSPVKYRRSRRSRSFSPAARFARDRRSRSPLRSRHKKDYGNRRPYLRDIRDNDRVDRRERERSHDRYFLAARRSKRSESPRTRKTSRIGSTSPKRHRESLSPTSRKSSRKSSRSPRHHHESRSSPRHAHTSTSYQRKRSRSKSAEGRPRSDSRRDGDKSERSKRDKRSPMKIRDADEKHRTSKGSRNAAEDVDSDSSAPPQRKSPLLVEDERIRDGKDGRDRNKHKLSRLDDKGSGQLDATMKDKKEYKKSTENRNSEDEIKYEKSSSDHRKHEKVDTSRRERNSSGRDRIRTSSDDLSKHGRSTSEYKRHEKVESVSRKRDSLDDDSTIRREGRKGSNYSKEKYQSSSKHEEDIRGRKDQPSLETHEETINISEEIISVGFPSSDPKLSSPKTCKSSSPIKNGTSKDPSDFNEDEEFVMESVKIERFDPISEREDSNYICLEVGGYDVTIADGSKVQECNIQTGKTSPAPNEHYYRSDRPIEVEETAYLANVRSREVSPISHNSRNPMDVQEFGSCDVSDLDYGQLPRVDSVVKDQDSLKYSARMTCGSSPSDLGWPSVVEDQNGHKQSILEDENTAKTALNVDKNVIRDDSTKLVEDNCKTVGSPFKTMGSPVLTIHKGRSMSPEVDRNENALRGIEDICLNESIK